MIPVVDASVVIKWYFQEEDSERAYAILDEPRIGFFAPDVVFGEVANVCLRRLKEDPAVDAMARAMFKELVAVLTPVDSRRIVEIAFDISRSINHKVFDCMYLAAARSLDAPLITSDKELLHRSRRLSSPLQVIGLAEWSASHLPPVVQP